LREECKRGWWDRQLVNELENLVQVAPGLREMTLAEEELLK